MKMIDRAGGVCLLLAMAGTAAAPAAAQEAQPAAADQAQAAEANRDARAVEILNASQTAITEASSLAFGVVKTMEKTDELAPENAIFASISIGAKGAVTAAKDDEGRWSYKIDGTADDIGRPDAFEIVLRRGPETVSWLDQESRTLVTSNPRLARGRELSTETEFGVQYIFGAPRGKPLAEVLAAPSLEVLEPEVVDGVLCDVVRARFDRPNESGDKIVYIGGVDGLPRLVRDVLVTGFENRLAYTFETPDEPPTLESLELEAPQGWPLVYRPDSLRPETTAQTRPLNAVAEGDGTVGYEVGDRAPAFNGQTLLGDSVSSESIAGKPAVLVFWASWIPGADEIVGFLEATRKAGGDGIELVTFAVRERSPDNAFNLLSTAGLDDVPLIVDARDSMLAYGVTRAPIVMIIDADGVIQYRSVGSDLATILPEATGILEGLTDGE